MHHRFVYVVGVQDESALQRESGQSVFLCHLKRVGMFGEGARIAATAFDFGLVGELLVQVGIANRTGRFAVPRHVAIHADVDTGNGLRRIARRQARQSGDGHRE